MSGWIKLHRRLLEWEWYTDSKTVHLFIHLLLKCNREARKWRGITVEKGQLITSRDTLSFETGISVRSIRTILERLKTTSELTIKTTSRFTIITICKWDTYQPCLLQIDQQNDQPSDQQTTSKRPANDQQTTTNKNNKNIENDKKEKEETPRAERPDVELPAMPVEKSVGVDDYLKEVGKAVRDYLLKKFNHPVADVSGFVASARKSGLPANHIADMLEWASVYEYAKHMRTAQAFTSSLMHNMRKFQTEEGWREIFKERSYV